MGTPGFNGVERSRQLSGLLDAVRLPAEYLRWLCEDRARCCIEGLVWGVPRSS